MMDLNTGNMTTLSPVIDLVPAKVRGVSGNRLLIVLRAPGCAYDLRPEGGCTYCNFRSLTTHGVPVSAEDLIHQVNHALAGIDCHKQRILEIDLYNSGNFLNDSEVPPLARSAILRRCAEESAVRVVLVESRPEYITAARIKELVLAMRRSEPLALEVGIGLETADDQVREQGLRKGITRHSFERAVRVLGETKADLLTYLMLKPMPMSDEQALRDVKTSAEYVFDIAARHHVRARVALELTFVVPGTPLAFDYLKGKYAPPSLWLALEVVKSIAVLGDVSVGLWDEGLGPLAKSDSCEACRRRVITAIRRFNTTQDRGVLSISNCLCQESISLLEVSSDNLSRQRLTAAMAESRVGVVLGSAARSAAQPHS
jgi:radical SAM enzyme (TIGR01210 family)